MCLSNFLKFPWRTLKNVVAFSSAYPMVDHLASIRTSTHPSINFFSLLHLRDHLSDFFKTCLRCSPRGLVVSARKWFLSVDKHSRLSHLWFSPLLHLLQNQWRNFVETLHMNSSQCLDVSAWKLFWSVNKYGRRTAIFKIVNCPLLNTVTISLSHLLWTTGQIFQNLSEMFP